MLEMCFYQCQGLWYLPKSAIICRCEREEVDGSEKQTYAKSSTTTRTSFAPKKRGEKARTKRK